MYCALSTDGKKVIAIHDDIDVVEKYIDNIEKNHNIRLPIGKIKKKQLKKHPEYNDLYLVRYNNIYVQAEYLETLSIISEDYIYDYRCAIEILLRSLEVEDMSENDMKAIKKSIKVLDKIIKSYEEYVPELSTLQSTKMDLEAFRDKCY